MSQKGSEDVSLVCKTGEVVMKVWNNLKRTQFLQCRARMEKLELSSIKHTIPKSYFRNLIQETSLNLFFSHIHQAPQLYHQLKQDLRESKASVAVDGPPSDLENTD